MLAILAPRIVRYLLLNIEVVMVIASLLVVAWKGGRYIMRDDSHVAQPISLGDGRYMTSCLVYACTNEAEQCTTCHRFVCKEHATDGRCQVCINVVKIKQT